MWLHIEPSSITTARPSATGRSHGGTDAVATTTTATSNNNRTLQVLTAVEVASKLRWRKTVITNPVVGAQRVWTSVDLTDVATKSWLPPSSPSSPADVRSVPPSVRRRSGTVRVACYGGCRVGETVTKSGGSGGEMYRPYLTVEVEEPQRLRAPFDDEGEVRRRRRKRSLRCFDGTLNCCLRHHLYVNFTQLGWNFIQSPPGYTHYYCQGPCNGTKTRFIYYAYSYLYRLNYYLIYIYIIPTYVV